jgi:hypothetical protein
MIYICLNNTDIKQPKLSVIIRFYLKCVHFKLETST